jgi:hypothetical protein
VVYLIDYHDAARRIGVKLGIPEWIIEGMRGIELPEDELKLINDAYEALKVITGKEKPTWGDHLRVVDVLKVCGLLE